MQRRARLMIFAAAFGLASPLSARETYTAGVEASFPPWAYVQEGEYKGIAIDAMRAIAEHQGIDVEVTDPPWPSLIPALAQGRIDLLVTGLNVTEDRAGVLDFTIPGRENDDEILVPTDSEKILSRRSAAAPRSAHRTVRRKATGSKLVGRERGSRALDPRL